MDFSIPEGCLAVMERLAACGYPSAQCFAPIFAKTFGATPDVWRKRLFCGLKKIVYYSFCKLLS